MRISCQICSVRTKADSIQAQVRDINIRRRAVNFPAHGPLTSRPQCDTIQAMTTVQNDSSLAKLHDAMVGARRSYRGARKNRPFTEPIA